jgi:4'-phosphopantetheinyl transferase EntD
MNSQTVFQAWREVLPAGVYVSAGPLLETSVPLTARERESAGSVETQRMCEFENGRTYAKRALAMLGIRNVDLPIAPNRSPLWPAGVIGSLTHVVGRVDAHFAAAVARTENVCALGIDIECDSGLHPRLWDYVLTRRECERISILPPHERTIEAQAIWCAKEAVSKAAQKPIEPTEVDIVRYPSGGGFVASWRPKRPVMGPAEFWHGRITRSQGYILAAWLGRQLPHVQECGLAIIQMALGLNENRTHIRCAPLH